MPVFTLPEPALARTVRGAGSGQPGLLLAHGAGGGIEANYGPILDGLAAGRTVVGADFPGSGATPRSTEPLELDVLADQLVAAADAEGLETFAVSGYSLGGPVAIRAATRHPERVTALVLTATFAHADTKFDLAASVWRQLCESGDRLLLAEFSTLMAFGTSALNAFTPAQVRAAAEALAESVPPGTPDHIELARRIDVRADLAALTIPTLLITTTADPLVPLSLQEELADTIPGVHRADLATGHLPFAERPEEWLRLITTFLDAQAQG
ncbi:alpha/beta fold hydrolase [Streptomyces sp. CBMA152]|uniref:alpha/beta fold hydrolase n=1 Tax=Streptomyces sp. CBMA152 TaxID=1896312 RepID=UPI0016611556|nr:alpha/beta fold hydrolase [Streptomyces sp. CBMA152]MBD0741224.1 alpha/beta hydrolase [Streptomyces sp. CBMA152]